MAVFKCHLTLRGLANVRNDIFTFDRIAPDQFGHRRLAGLLVIYKMPHTYALKKSDAPAI
jgi:hypothetical protein